MRLLAGVITCSVGSLLILGSAQADTTLIVSGTSRVARVVCDGELGPAVLMPVPTQGDAGIDRAIALLVATPNSEPSIVTGISEQYEGALYVRIARGSGNALFAGLGSDQPVEVSRLNLGYTIPGQGAGQAVNRAVTNCHAAEPGAGVALPPGNFWKSKDAILKLEAVKGSRKFVFFNPTPEMRAIGIQPGTTRFEGQLSSGAYVGTAYLFTEHCGRVAFKAIGRIENNDETVVLSGQATSFDNFCNKVGTRDVSLRFDYIKQNR